ncbi:tRNA (adenosine(37)-N6)-threonylcarbamoyltransferase complex dimerization subunit type 1 TsaB [Chondrinema litorale]|uniref:tRNA (adenosine(37)-N6)-threonylcarbamoyltransferase complex dimerization subunit type 1 TsaB n=1 Tax=Chondrinema litorale TaxID=2994555 RepID=UPI002544A18E|nr:tRNA (adenosine(37)-N6)-threonylcarbamoyltransferase complex dimerization subunit type 1 TsaB [Chondrinema litorale]UZR95531.1 tRNA (adenosine(37)-N6)-threonylcarbamoyltransferase complex dimerization subunit type 1 TsaB [Chondrinema litorale]
MLLSIETATSVCSVALHSEENIIAYEEIHLEKSHSGYLTVIIDQMMKNCQVISENIEAIAVSEGPGSYTGLRIGVSTAKGLCYAWDKPLISVSTLEAIAANAIDHLKYLASGKMLFCPMLDARRMEVYTAIYKSDLSQIKAIHPLVVESSSFDNYLQDYKILYFGNGAEKCKDVLVNDNLIYVGEYLPNAKYVGLIANKALREQQFADLAYFEPFYLKAYQAKKPKKNKLLS